MQTESNGQIRLFVPADLTVEPKQTDTFLGHLFSIRCKGRILTVIVVECSGELLPYPCNENPVGRVASQYSGGHDHVQFECKVTYDHLGIACLQLETALAACSLCQVVYYDRSRPGTRHYGTSHADTSLSHALHLLNHQHSATHKSKNFLGWLHVCLTASPETNYQTAYGSMLYDDIKGWLCRTGTLCSECTLTFKLVSDNDHVAGCSSDGSNDGGATCSDTAAENRSLLQTRQRGLAALMQHLAGICLATFLLTYHVKCWEGIACTAIYIKTQAVEQQIEWLMGAPAGISAHMHKQHKNSCIPL